MKYIRFLYSTEHCGEIIDITDIVFHLVDSNTFEFILRLKKSLRQRVQVAEFGLKTLAWEELTMLRTNLNGCFQLKDLRFMVVSF